MSNLVPPNIDKWLINKQAKATREKVERWLWEIAHNNAGTSFCKAVIEVIERLDGFERFWIEEVEEARKIAERETK